MNRMSTCRVLGGAHLELFHFPASPRTLNGSSAGRFARSAQKPDPSMFASCIFIKERCLHRRPAFLETSILLVPFPPVVASRERPGPGSNNLVQSEISPS